jgi:hypothetical protein
MIDESALRDALLSSIEESKNLYVMLSSILAELDALRETVRGLDPTFGDVMEQKRLEAVARQDEVVRASIAAYDEKSARVRAGYVC